MFSRYRLKFRKIDSEMVNKKLFYPFKINTEKEYAKKVNDI